ncbi:MAG: hypothetical protein Q7R73_03335 [bacterium]|nr:hypothetical protein [bacterium]
MPNIVQQNSFDKIVAMREASFVKLREIKKRKQEEHIRERYSELLQRFLNYYTKCSSNSLSSDVKVALEEMVTKSSYRKICAVAVPSCLGTAYLTVAFSWAGFGLGVMVSILYACAVGLLQFFSCAYDFTWVNAIRFLFAKHREKKRIAEKSSEPFPHEVTF